MTRYIRPTCAALLLAATPAPALAHGFGAEATLARADHQWGGELGLGYDLAFGPLHLRPIGGAFVYQGDDDRYYEDRFANGQKRCRDSRTGHFAESSRCNDAQVKGYAKIEAAISPAGGVEIGGGGRFMGDSLRPYGFVAVPVAPRIRVVGAGGAKYFAVGLRAGF